MHQSRQTWLSQAYFDHDLHLPANQRGDSSFLKRDLFGVAVCCESEKISVAGNSELFTEKVTCREVNIVDSGEKKSVAAQKFMEDKPARLAVLFSGEQRLPSSLITASVGARLGSTNPLSSSMPLSAFPLSFSIPRMDLSQSMPDVTFLVNSAQVGPSR